jgi:signal transduction histidine kinase
MCHGPGLLHAFVTAHRSELITLTRAKVALRSSPTPTQTELMSGIPLFLDQLAEALRLASPPSAETTRTIEASASSHGEMLLKRGFTVAQVVRDYGDACQAITELANEVDEPITTDEFHTLNLCLDNAIAQAVSGYTQLHDRQIADEETERTGSFSHELRNRLSATTLAFAMLQKGTAPMGGSVASVVALNLQRMRALIDRSLVDVRVDSGSVSRQKVMLHDIIEEAEVDGALEASERGLSLSVTPTPPRVVVDVDPQILAGALANLLQNAFKFSAPGGHIVLRAVATESRVEIEVEDECGGLPPGKADALFGAFQQRGRDRTGLGLGLFISRKGVESCGGTLRVRDVPGRGCVFTIDLPRVA